MTKGDGRPALKLKEMDEKAMHNLFLKNMAGLIEATIRDRPDQPKPHLTTLSQLVTINIKIP